MNNQKHLTPEQVQELMNLGVEVKPLKNDYVGAVFGRLTVIEESERRRAKKRNKYGKINSSRMMLCRCECGNITNVSLQRLREGLTISCGCYQREQSHKKKKLVFGVGINDYDGLVRIGTKNIESYNCWVHMIERVYSQSYKDKFPTYNDCVVCDEWLHFANFKLWFDVNYIEGYHLDKDVLIQGNKTYSPDVCCFLPPNINIMMAYTVGNKTTGVNLRKAGKGRRINDVYEVSIGKNGRRKHLGSFKNKEDAVEAFKLAKESQIKSMAQKYYDSGEISERIYNALLNHKVYKNHPESLTKTE